MPKFILVTCAGPHGGPGGDMLISATVKISNQTYTEIRLSTGGVITVSDSIRSITTALDSTAPGACLF